MRWPRGENKKALCSDAQRAFIPGRLHSSARLLNLSDGGRLPLGSSYSPHGSSAGSGLVSTAGARHPIMLRSACYPCRFARCDSNFWTRQCPRFYRSPVRSAAGWGGADGCRYSTPGAALLAQFSLDPSQVPERVTAHDSICTVERLGSLWSTTTPVCVEPQQATLSEPDSSPRSDVLWNGSRVSGQPWHPHACARSPARLPTGILLNLLSRTFSSQFLLGPPARLDCLSRDPAACFWCARFPCRCPFNHPWFKFCSGCDSTPESIASRCGRGSRHRAA